MAIKKQEIVISPSIVWQTIGILLLVSFLYLIKDILLLLFLAFIMVSATSPIVDKFEKRKVPRVFTALFLYFIFFIFFILILWSIVPSFVMELKLLAENLPVYFENMNSFFASLNEFLSQYQYGEGLQKTIEGLTKSLDQSISNLFSNALSFLLSVFRFLVVVSLSFYMLVKKEGAKSFLKLLVSRKHQSYIFDLFSRIQTKMGRWLVGQFVLMLLIFALNYLSFMALKVPFAMVLAIFAGLMEIIPYIGPTIALIPAVLVALTVSPLTAVFVLIFYILIQQLENHLIVPLLMKKAVGLNPVIVIVALLIGAKIAGVLGIIIAVPLATSLEILIDDILNNRFLKKVNAK